MTGAGRPLRFLLLLSGGWIAMRAVMLWPVAEEAVERLLEEVAGEAPAMAADAFKPASPSRVTIALPPRTTAPRGLGAMARRMPRLAEKMAPFDPASSAVIALAVAGANPAPDPVGRAPAAQSGKWSASAWLIARDGGRATLAPGGVIGGSQAGVRVAYRPVERSSLALFGRVSRPLGDEGTEAAVGAEIQPIAAVPIRAALEQRVALESGAAEGTALSLVGGIDGVRIAGGLVMDGYGQAGIIGLRRRTGFVDGAARVMRPLVRDGVGLAVGGGVWGAAQPGAARLDIGPRVEVRPLIGGERYRLGIEWRERVAGNARPGSGPALTLGADF